MTEQLFPITPSPELLQDWGGRFYDQQLTFDELVIEVYKAGADQELEACCEWLIKSPYGATLAANFVIEKLRTARRPKPPSLRKQAYDALDTYIYGEPDPKDKERTYNTIRRALEALPND